MIYLDVTLSPLFISFHEAPFLVMKPSSSVFLHITAFVDAINNPEVIAAGVPPDFLHLLWVAADIASQVHRQSGAALDMVLGATIERTFPRQWTAERPHCGRPALPFHPFAERGDLLGAHVLHLDSPFLLSWMSVEERNCEPSVNEQVQPTYRRDTGTG